MLNSEACCGLFLGGVPVGSPTSIGDFVCVMCVTKIASYQGWVFYSPNLYWDQASSSREYKQLSVCTLSLQYCKAWPKPGTPPTLQGCNLFYTYRPLNLFYIRDTSLKIRPVWPKFNLCLRFLYWIIKFTKSEHQLTTSPIDLFYIFP